jgi:TPR repeat protein
MRRVQATIFRATGFALGFAIVGKLTIGRALAALFLMAIFLTASLAGPVSATPLDDAVAAGDRGDTATALRLLRPLAEQGDPAAQYDLGIMYFVGQGVAQNATEAANWFRKAAEQGDLNAQYNLGALYDHGYGVAQRPTSAACTTTGAACRWTMPRR